MRALSSAALAALQRSPLPIAVLIEMDLVPALYLTTGGDNITLSGTTYYATKGLGSVGAVRETPAEFPQMAFELSGVTSEAIAVALGTQVQGVAARIKVAIFDPDTYQVIETRLRWSGRLDLMTIVDSSPSPVIQVTAEHAGIDLLRATNRIYSDADQRLDYPTDPSLQYIADQVEQRIVWPAASWGKE